MTYGWFLVVGEKTCLYSLYDCIREPWTFLFNHYEIKIQDKIGVMVNQILATPRRRPKFAKSGIITLKKKKKIFIET